MDQSDVTGSSTSYGGPKKSPENTLRNVLTRGVPASLKISVLPVPFQISVDSITLFRRAAQELQRPTVSS